MQSSAVVERPQSFTRVQTAPRRRVPARIARVPAVDLLRGFVIVLMALDHVREIFTGTHFDPTDLTQTTVPLFLTRWITHFCAPVFVLLAGVSGWMAGRKRTREELSWLLVTRGLWLVLLEFTVVNFAWYFNLKFEFGFAAQVIWAIGVSMVVLAGLAWLPRAVIAAIGMLLVGGHNLLDRFDTQMSGSLWYAILHVRHPFPEHHFFVIYPVLPWIGVMALGYALGPLLARPSSERNPTLVNLGLGSCLAFAVLRLADVYGDPSGFVAQGSATFSVLSFLNTTKYPPSLQYLLMTLGPALLAIPAMERLGALPARILEVFGRAPLFFYVVHIYLIHLLAVGAGMLAGFTAKQMMVLFVGLPVEFGYGLPVVYLLWVAVLLLLYWPTHWFGERKLKGGQWWWAYL